MKGDSQPLPDQTVACDVCMKEIPASEARSEEASDYVIYFCGLDCYQTWSSQIQEDEAQTS